MNSGVTLLRESKTSKHYFSSGEAPCMFHNYRRLLVLRDGFLFSFYVLLQNIQMIGA